MPAYYEVLWLVEFLPLLAIILVVLAVLSHRHQTRKKKTATAPMIGFLLLLMLLGIPLANYYLYVYGRAAFRSIATSASVRRAPSGRYPLSVGNVWEYAGQAKVMDFRFPIKKKVAIFQKLQLKDRRIAYEVEETVTTKMATEKHYSLMVPVDHGIAVYALTGRQTGQTEPSGDAVIIDLYGERQARSVVMNRQEGWTEVGWALDGKANTQLHEGVIDTPSAKFNCPITRRAEGTFRLVGWLFPSIQVVKTDFFSEGVGIVAETEEFRIATVNVTVEYNLINCSLNP
jgi:hypothetical protein